MTDNDVRKFRSAMLAQENHNIDARTDNCVRRCAAKVVSEENEYHYATVCLPIDPATTMRLMNCSGKYLSPGDSVWLEWMHGFDNVYIAIKNDGEPWGW